MRPQGRGPLDSLYFTYPKFAAPKVAELQGVSKQHRVAIAGAGPIGMTAALTLARYGVASVLLDCKDTFNDGSRATCIARSSMQIFEQIGAIEPFLPKSLGWRYGSTFYQGKLVYRLQMPHSDHDKYLPMYNLQQQYLEQYLYQAVEKCPLIDMRWCSTVSDAKAAPDGVILHVESPLGNYRLNADYALAADGARSPMRGFLGLRLAGDNYEGKYVIADVKMKHDHPTERRAFFDPASNRDGTILVHKQPDDIWRIDYQLREGEDESEAISEARIRARVGAMLADIGHTGDWELEWWSIYSANTLCLDNYKHGRVIFIGDSAHIVPIFGVRGLNNGLADAFNAGWKLAYVINGIAQPALLDSYSPERRGATLDVFANATKSTRFMTPPTRGWKLMRDAALSLGVRNEFARRFADPRQMTPYTYADSRLTPFASRDADFTAGPASGALCVNVRLADGGYLLDHVGPGFTAMVFGRDRSSNSTVRPLGDLARLDPNFKALAIGDGGDLDDPGGTIASLFDAEPGTIYLIRPDLHVAGRWRQPAAPEIIATMQAGLGDFSQ